MCILAMLHNEVYTAEQILNDSVFTIQCGEIKKKELYLVSFKKLSHCFINHTLKQFAEDKGFALESDVTAKNPYGDDVFLYEL